MSSFIKALELDKVDLRGKLIAIDQEAGGDGNFCLSCLMWQCLSHPNSGLLLLATHHSYNHYYHVGMKLGYNLSSQSKRAIILELGKSPYGDTDDEAFSKDEDSLTKLFLTLKSKLSQLKTENEKVYLFIDNASSLLFFGCKPEHVKIFLHYIRTLLDDRVTLVILNQTHPNDDEELRIASFLRHVSDIRLRVAPLKTGSSQEVTGSIELKSKDVESMDLWRKPTFYHYKLSERNVKIFLPGNI